MQSLSVGVHVKMAVADVEAVKAVAISNGYSFSCAVRQLLRAGLATVTK